MKTGFARLVFTLGVAAAASAGYFAAAGAHGDYLGVWDGQVLTDTGALRTLGPLEFAMTSAGGGAYAVVTLKKGEFPPAATVAVYDRAGRELWRETETDATRAAVADSGAAALIAVVDPTAGPASPARVTLYDAAGARTADLELNGMPGMDVSFPGLDKVAVLTAGVGTVVYDLAGGREDYVADGGLGVAAGPGESLLILDRDRMALWRKGRREWDAGHDLYFPRMAVVNANASLAFVGAHHEVALVSLADGRVLRKWTCPGDFGVTDAAAAPDFTAFAVGMRTLAGAEAVVWLDGQLGDVKREDHTVTQPSGVSPAVVVWDDPVRVAAFGQGWRTTLAR